MQVEFDEKGWPVDCDSLIGREFIHFKGKRYQLLDFAKNSETEELVVVYRTLYGGQLNVTVMLDRGLNWRRSPMNSFDEQVLQHVRALKAIREKFLAAPNRKAAMAALPKLEPEDYAAVVESRAPGDEEGKMRS